MKLVIKENYQDLCHIAATYIVNKINNTKKDYFVLGLPTGSTPIGVYQNLVKYYKEGKVSFSKVITFNMDEYVGLGENDVESYAYFMKNNLFNHVDIPEENINLLNGLADNLEDECQRYENKIKQFPIDLFLCGIGTDGHIAFNEPGSSLNSVTRIKTLYMETIDSNSKFFENQNTIPNKALTVGIKTIMNAKEIILMASGRKKALAVKHLVEEPISSQWTSSKLQEHEKCMILCDDDSTDELRVKTVKYFRNLQNNTNIDGLPYPNCIEKYIRPNQKILITSPHPDDDIIGCGGLLQFLNFDKHFLNKKNIKVAYMTNGKGGIRSPNNRYKEALSALTLLGYGKDNIDQLTLPFYQNFNRTISKEDSLVFEKYLEDYKPEHMFVCCDIDPKRTHLKCLEIIRNSKFPESLKYIWLYKSAWDKWDGNSQIKENTSIKLSKDQYDVKINSLKMHLSQFPLLINDINDEDLIDRCEKLNKNDYGEYLERFKVLSKEEFQTNSLFKE